MEYNRHRHYIALSEFNRFRLESKLESGPDSSSLARLRDAYVHIRSSSSSSLRRLWLTASYIYAFDWPAAASLRFRLSGISGGGGRGRRNETFTAS